MSNVYDTYRKSKDVAKNPVYELIELIAATCIKRVRSRDFNDKVTVGDDGQSEIYQGS